MRSSLAVPLLLIGFTNPLFAVDWQPMTAELIQKEKPGFGGLSGVAVDHSNGTIFIDVSDRGVFRSTDQGKTWERYTKDLIKGRTETPGCMMLDPTGKSKRILLPTVYGAPIGIGSKEEIKWQFMNAKSNHVDWCALDWTDPESKFILTLKHESGGLLLRSHDSGKTFEEVGKGYSFAWVFDANTAVVAKPKSKEQPKAEIVRTTDGGKTFQPCGEYSPVAIPRWHEDTLYWLVTGAMIKTKDKGTTWEKVCEIKDSWCGPVFGKDAKHLLVLTKTGVIESTDGGGTWSKPIPLPNWKGYAGLHWLDYDPKQEIFYVMKMGSDLYKLPRPKNQ
jgi:photosystem II stability/assembly factor-like uncharacterized protein